MQTQTPRYFETAEQTETFMRASGAAGFAHRGNRGFIAVVMFDGLMWAMTSETRMVHLDQW